MLDGDKEVKAALANFNPWQKMMDFLAMQEILYEKAGMLLDSSYVVPMGSGLPIRLDVSGSAACNFKISKMFNSRRADNEFQLTGNIASRFVAVIIPILSLRNLTMRSSSLVFFNVNVIFSSQCKCRRGRHDGSRRFLQICRAQATLERLLFRIRAASSESERHSFGARESRSTKSQHRSALIAIGCRSDQR